MVVDPAGAIDRTIPLRIGATNFEFARFPQGFVIAVNQPRADVIAGRARALHAVDSTGRPLWTACELDRSYQESSRRNGLLGEFQVFGIAYRDGRLYCRQPNTPVVQVFDESGRPLATIRSSPPFFTRPDDVPMTMNAVTFNRFIGKFWQHLNFYPTRTGYSSIFYQRDSATGASVYRIFSLDSTSQRRFSLSELQNKPVDWIEPDTLVAVAFGPSSDAAPQLVFYHVAR